MPQLPPLTTVATVGQYRFGPAMTALSDRQRAFVLNWNNGGGDNGAECARNAGYSDQGDAAKVQAHRMLHDPRIQAAIREDISARFTGDLAETKRLLDEIAQNPQHKDQLKALITRLHHAGLVERTVTEHTGTIELTYEQRIDKLHQLAVQAGKKPEDFLPPGTTISDAEFVEVPQVTLDDLI